MKNHHNKLVWAVILSEASHVFCCVLPTLFSLLSLLSGLGLIVTMPTGLVHIHELLHHYELHMILFSAIVLIFGWWFYFYSKKHDCHQTGCDHRSCIPQKKRARKILIAASILFAINVSVYFGIHRTAMPFMIENRHEESVS